MFRVSIANLKTDQVDHIYHVLNAVSQLLQADEVFMKERSLERLTSENHTGLQDNRMIENRAP